MNTGKSLGLCRFSHNIHALLDSGQYHGRVCVWGGHKPLTDASTLFSYIIKENKTSALVIFVL